MSDFLKEYRTKYPQYDDLTDEQLAGALRQKYNADTGSDLSADAFYSSIGYRPIKTPQVEAPEAAVAEEAPDYNLLRGAGERAATLGSEFLGAIDTTAEALEREVPLGGLMIGVPRKTLEKAGVEPNFYLGDYGFGLASSEDRQKVLNVDPNVDPIKYAEGELEAVDLGYKEQTNWEDVKNAFSEEGAFDIDPYLEAGAFSVEQGVKSVPDMVSAIYALPAYIFARSGEIGKVRAENKGKEEVSIEDIAEAVPFAVASSLLERFGARGMTQAGADTLGKEMLKTGLENASKQVLAAGGKGLIKEVATEAIQEGMIEYLGEQLGTDAALEWEEGIDRALAGAVGSAYAGPVAAGKAAVDRTLYSPEREIARAIEAEVDAAIPSESGLEAATRAFEPPQPAISDKAPEEKTMAQLVTEKRAEIRGVTPQEIAAVDEAKVEAEKSDVELNLGGDESQEKKRARSEEAGPVRDEGRVVQQRTDTVAEEPTRGARQTLSDSQPVTEQDAALMSFSDIENLPWHDFRKIAKKRGLKIGPYDNKQEAYSKFAEKLNIPIPSQKIEIPEKEETRLSPQENNAFTEGANELVVGEKYKDIDDVQRRADPTDISIGIEYWAKSKGYEAVISGSQSSQSKYITISKPTNLFDEDGDRINLEIKVRVSDHAVRYGGTDINISPDKSGYSIKEALELIEDAQPSPNAQLVLGEPISNKMAPGSVVFKQKEIERQRIEQAQAPIADPVDGAYLEPVLEPVTKSSAVIQSEYTPTVPEQASAIEQTQTEKDAEQSAELTVKEPEMSRDGAVTYPQPEQDINTRDYIESDKHPTPPLKDGEKVFHSPGHNYVGLFRSTGIPPRQEVFSIDGKRVRMPAKPQRIEPIMSDLVKIMGRRIYFGKIKGRSSEGFYRPEVGEIRTRRKNDVEVLAHEMAHYLDLYSNETLPNFAEQYKDPRYVEQVTSLSYTDANRNLKEIEGFAEFVRLWLTNSQEAQLRAPTYYKAFNGLLKTDKALDRTMRSLQQKMHKFYFQGADKLGQALIGKEQSFLQTFNEWAYRRDSRIRQQVIDRFHAARKIEQELTGRIGNVQESAWKQFRIANGGAEGIADYILNYGTLNFDEKGDLQSTGKSLHDVLEPVKTLEVKDKHKGDSPIDLLMRYFAGRRALELHGQGRENLIPKETAMKWARLGGDYPIFERIAKEYQAFNDRMMDFYQDAGMITAEGREIMQSLNKDYVPFNRIRDQLAGSNASASAGFKKLRGGTANLNDILVNIQDGIVANVQSALTNKAKQRLYQYIASYKDGAIFATRISPDSRLVRVHNEDMASKINDVLEKNGIQVAKLDLSDPELTQFWQHGVKPRVTESGNIIDSVIVDGKPRYYEVQDPLLQEMLLAMNPESYSTFMNVMFGIKNFFTRAITLGVEFTGANLVRDTTGATFISKNNFKPFIDSFKGMYSFLTKDKAYQDFLRSGAGYSSRAQALTKEGSARRRVKLDEFGVMTPIESILSTIDNIASAFEYGTRIGEFKVAKKNHRSDMDAGYAGREISTDFSVMGANRFLTGYIRTIPFMNAMIQSQDRVFREAFVSKKYDGNPTGMAMKAFLGITLPTLALYLVNKDDEDYKEIPDYEKRTNWHIKVGDNQFIKIPRPYDVGFVYATMPELFFKYLEDEEGKEFADGLIWTLTQMYGVDGTPAMLAGWWDLVRNKKWTGSPVVPKSLSNVEAPEQYTSNTSETFVRLGEAIGISPIKAEHMFNAYTGYLGGYLLAGTDYMMWDEDRFGPRPENDISENIFLRRFITPEDRPYTQSMEKFFDLKEKSDRVVATFKQQIDARRAIKGQMKEGAGRFKGDRFFGLNAEEKAVLFSLNDSMNDLVKLVFGKNGIKTAELAIKYNRNLTAEEKRERMDDLWKSKNKLFMEYYDKANAALKKARKSVSKEN